MLKCICICNLTYPARKAHGPYYSAICGLWGSNIFLSIISQTTQFSGKSYRTQIVLIFYTTFENCGLLGYYATSSCNFLPTYRDNLSVPFSGFMNTKVKNSWTLRMVPICCPETSVRNYFYSLRNNPEERSSQLLRRGSLKSRLIQILSKTFFILRQIQRGIITHAHGCSCKVPIILVRF
jgi:hypothetical protein